MQVDTQAKPRSDEKQELILNAAFGAFAQYGFRRVSMDEIAKRAGMSRAALYLHFRNKEAIFSVLVLRFFEDASANMAAALAGAPDPISALKAAFAAKIAPPYDLMMQSPHGEELLDVKTTAAADAVAQGEAAIVRVFADWVTAEVGVGRIALDPFDTAEDVGQTLLQAVHGVVAEACDYDRLRVDLDRLATLLGRGLTVAS